MKEDVEISVVIPVFNEAANLKELIARCVASCERMGHWYEIILVDDGSKDGSTPMISHAAEKHACVKGVMLNRNYGQHAAVLAGFGQARGDIIVTLDADLQNPPEEIPNLVRQVKLGFDVVGSVREDRRDTAFRKISSFIINKTVQKATGVKMNDYGCMLRAYKRHIVDAVLKCPERSTFIPVLANSFAGSTTEIRVKHAQRQNGSSKYSLMKLISLQFDLLTCMTTFPLRLLSILGGLFSLFGVGFGCVLMGMRFFLGAAWAAEGIFTLFSILFVLVGSQFLAFGLLGEYIGRIYNDVRARPKYFIREIVDSSDEGSSRPSGKNIVAITHR